MGLKHKYGLPSLFTNWQSNLEQSLYTILQIVSVTLFEKIPPFQALTDIKAMKENIETNKQLNLFD